MSSENNKKKGNFFSGFQKRAGLIGDTINSMSTGLKRRLLRNRAALNIKTFRSRIQELNDQLKKTDHFYNEPRRYFQIMSSEHRPVNGVRVGYTVPSKGSAQVVSTRTQTPVTNRRGYKETLLTTHYGNNTDHKVTHKVTYEKPWEKSLLKEYFLKKRGY